MFSFINMNLSFESKTLNIPALYWRSLQTFEPLAIPYSPTIYIWYARWHMLSSRRPWSSHDTKTTFSFHFRLLTKDTGGFAHTYFGPPVPEQTQANYNLDNKRISTKHAQENAVKVFHLQADITDRQTGQEKNDNDITHKNPPYTLTHLYSLSIQREKVLLLRTKMVV